MAAHNQFEAPFFSATCYVARLVDAVMKLSVSLANVCQVDEPIPVQIAELAANRVAEKVFECRSVLTTQY